MDYRKFIDEIKARDGITCHYCGKKTGKYERQLDHIIPQSAGGIDHPDNLVIACKVCNRKKSNKNYKVFIRDEISRVQLHLNTLMALLE